MVRIARIKAPNQIYSVVTRVNNSDFAFGDFSLNQAFLNHLKLMKTKFNFKLYGFVIMSSHVHLLIEPSNENSDNSDISRIMMHINGKFAQKYNMTFKRKGHFWMQRFSSKIVERGQYLLNTLIYFALNPVKANITDNPLKHKFSSIHNVVDGSFGDLIDELPEKYKQQLLNFLNENKFLEIIEKCERILKQFSFNLKKTRFEQKFRHFIGSKQFRNNLGNNLLIKPQLS